MSKRDRDLSKARKLLALAKDKAAAPNERATASRMAEALLKRHGLELSAAERPEAQPVDFTKWTEETSEAVFNWMYEQAVAERPPYSRFAQTMFRAAEARRQAVEDPDSLLAETLRQRTMSRAAEAIRQAVEDPDSSVSEALRQANRNAQQRRAARKGEQQRLDL